MDLLRWQVVGPAIRHRRTRTTLQLLLLVLAGVVVVHGLAGPDIAPRNLSTVLTWVHYRGLLVVGLLAVGNLFCAVCPMIAVRDAGRRLVHPAWRWPGWLRTKWPGLILFAAVLFCYELFDLWSLPAATAWLVLAYFAAAVAIDVPFAGASFCKYVCPVGQFNFVAATLSPTEVRPRDLDVCGACRTQDCIRGRRDGETRAPLVAPAVAGGRRPLPVLRGCELHLFLPAKVGNLDCTFCFDCARACPHDNVALASRLPGDELLWAGRRSGVGRLQRRPDLAALAVLFTFGACLNAFAMTAPAIGLERRLTSALGVSTEAVPLGVLFVLVLGVAPLMLFAAAHLGTRLFAAGPPAVSGAAIVWLAYALVPLGVGIWAAHYGFHLLTGLFTVVPVSQSALIDLTGRAVAGEPAWWLAGMRPGSVYPLQLGAIVLGAFGSAALVHQLAGRLSPARPGAVAVPWTLVVLTVAGAAAWILSQPMDMRGVGLPG